MNFLSLNQAGRLFVLRKPLWFSIAPSLIGLVALAILVGCDDSSSTPDAFPGPRIRVFSYGADFDEIRSGPNLLICEPVRLVGDTIRYEDSYALVPLGTRIAYADSSCKPEIRHDNAIATYRSDGVVEYIPVQTSDGILDPERIIWTPSRAIGAEASAISGRFLQPNAVVDCESAIPCSVSATVVEDEWEMWADWSEYMVGVRYAVFVNGEALRDENDRITTLYPLERIEDGAFPIGWLEREAAEELRDLINAGALR